MNIKKKSLILASMFSLLLILNAVGLFYSMSKIKNANEHLIEETIVASEFAQIKYILKGLQEVSFNSALVGDSEGLFKINELNREYQKLSSELRSKDISSSNKSQLNNIDSKMPKFISSLKKLTQFGITKSESSSMDEINSLGDKINMEMITTDEIFQTIESALKSIIEIEKKLVEQSIEEDHKVIENFKTIAVILTVAFIVCVVLLIIIITSILGNIKKLNLGVQDLLDSDEASKIEIDTNDEIGNIANNFNLYIDKLHNAISQDEVVIKEAQNIIGKVNVGLYNDRIKSKASSTVIQKLIDEINGMIIKSQGNLTILSEALINLANAKYSAPIPRIENVTGLMASILSGTKVTQSTVNEVMALIDNSNKRLTFSAEDLSAASAELSDASNKQAAALEQTAAAIEEVTSTIAISSENSAKMASYAKEVISSSSEGKDLASKTSISMDALSSEVNTINDAITVIDQIAFQTNILSLNAAVEAATAGEAGKGFAVVAAEVRNLAARSAEAANEIKALVESATTKAKEGKEVSSRMIDGFNKLDTNINTTIELIDEVATAAKEQQEAMNQINDTVNSLDQATQTNASLASNISSMADTTKDLSIQLQKAVDRTSFDPDAKRRVCNTDYIFDLNKLKSDHINFKNVNFRECQVGNKFKVKDHTQCDMGKWLIKSEQEGLAFTNSDLWIELKDTHQRFHHMVQDSVDLYAEDYANGQIIAVTENIELQMNVIYELLDRLKEHNCDLEFQRSRG